MNKKEEKCIILQYYHFLGKKWTYPILCHMKEGICYSFENLIYITNREISRSVLLDFIKTSKKLLLTEKCKKGYKLTKLAIELKEDFKTTKFTLNKYHPGIIDNCFSKTLINKKRINEINIENKH